MTGLLTMPELPFPTLRRGKVREVYEIDAERLLLVASDRISAFDVVLNEPIPRKGAVLTQLTAWWLRRFEGMVDHHMITADIDRIIAALPALAPFRGALDGRSMLCRRATVFPVECVIRGYLAGSAWKEYSVYGTLAGEPLAPGLRESEAFHPALFSPATKADTGHDENITVEQVREIVGASVAAELERLARQVYTAGCDIAAERGIIIADTKFEFGRIGDSIVLIDEVLTPDSSRFWPADGYAPGRSQPSFDKQPLRDYLEGERRKGLWDGDAPAPALPAETVRATSERYLDAYFRITGARLPATADEAGVTS